MNNSPMDEAYFMFICINGRLVSRRVELTPHTCSTMVIRGSYALKSDFEGFSIRVFGV